MNCPAKSSLLKNKWRVRVTPSLQPVLSFCRQDDRLCSVIPARFERATHSLEGCCSIQLSYGTSIHIILIIYIIAPFQSIFAFPAIFRFKIWLTACHLNRLLISCYKNCRRKINYFLSVCLCKRPFLFCIRPDFFKIFYSFICKHILCHAYKCFA